MQETWEQSLQKCIEKGATHSRPTNLVSIHSWAENEFVYQTLKQIREEGGSWYLDSVWTGLTKKEYGEYRVSLVSH